FEVDEAATRIREEVDQDANIILGATFDEALEGIIRVSVVATGIDRAASEVGPQDFGPSDGYLSKPAPVVEVGRPAAAPTAHAQPSAHAQPAAMVAPRAADPIGETVRTADPMPASAEAQRHAPADGFVPQSRLFPAPAQPAHAQQAQMQQAPAEVAPQPAPAP